VVKCLSFLVAAASMCLVSAAAGQTDSTVADAEAAIRAEYAAWNAADVDVLASGDTWATGFGFRSAAPRGVTPPDPHELRAGLERLFSSLEYFRLVIEELHLQDHGDVVVVWGIHTEDFKHVGRDAEFVRVRFSQTMLRQEGGGYRTILSHRDIQPFGADGRYVVGRE
jgi:hypothetical protein